jgi:hypothetical protein
VESVFEAVFEGSFRRVFNPRLQPIEVAHALERAMLADKAVGPSSVDVPSRYVARLNPADFDRFAPARNAHERSLAAYVDRRADEENLRPLGRIEVELVRDPSVARSFVKVDTRWDQPPDAAPEVEHTRRFERVREQQPDRALQLETEDGSSLTVDRRPIRIGRGADNDLVVRDVRVSRYHAAIEPNPNGWVIRDLDSTNGTYVDGERIREVRIDTEAELSLGGYRVALRPD